MNRVKFVKIALRISLVGIVLILFSYILVRACPWQLVLLIQNATGKQEKVIAKYGLNMRSSSSWLFMATYDMDSNKAYVFDVYPQPRVPNKKGDRNGVELYWKRVVGCGHVTEVFTSLLSPSAAIALDRYSADVDRQNHDDVFSALINGKKVVVARMDIGYQFFVIDSGLSVSISETDFAEAMSIAEEIL